MAGSRAQIVAALRDALPDTWDVKDRPLPIDEPSARIEAVVVVERQVVTPAPNQGSLFEEHHIWVIQPTHDIDTLEDLLDDNLETILTVIRDISWMTWETATRSNFTGYYHAYDVAVQVVTNIESE